MEYSEEELEGMNLEILTSLREDLINPVSIKSDFSEQLLEKVDLALMKHLDTMFINKK